MCFLYFCQDDEIHKMTLSDVTPVHSFADLDPKIVKRHKEDINLVRLGQYANN